MSTALIDGGLMMMEYGISLPADRASIVTSFFYNKAVEYITDRVILKVRYEKESNTVAFRVTINDFHFEKLCDAYQLKAMIDEPRYLKYVVTEMVKNIAEFMYIR